MIRKFHPDDLDSIMEIWLTSNKETHNYIPESYWDSNYQTVKGLIPHADIYVYILHNQIVGFIGLIDDYIAGLFVRKEFRSRGIGKLLLDKAKTNSPKLTLSVYTKNTHAIHFYKREHFVGISTSIDKQTGIEEIVMSWNHV